MDGYGSTAPVFPIPPRRIAALEHPALLRNVVRGLDTFGRNVEYSKIVHPDGPQSSVPLFLRHEDPSSSVLTSHNAASHNVVVAVTVPRRTGRRRRRGEAGPWEGDAVAGTESSGETVDKTDVALSGADLHQRDARKLRRALQNAAGHYKTEVVGVVQHTHRYRGLYDFQQSVANSPFMDKFTACVLPGDLDKLRQFVLTPGVAAPPNVDLPPPPFFTTQTLPFSYFYSQNPFVREVSTTDGAVQLVNSTARTAQAGYFLRFDHEPIPTAPPKSLPAIVGRRRNALLEELRQAVHTRPVWTRRGLVNHLRAATGHDLTENRLKPYFVHVCYQFKGGPWRDTLVRYGVDPRKDPACRAYQTLLFKLHRQADRRTASWHSLVEVEGEVDAEVEAKTAETRADVSQQEEGASGTPAGSAGTAAPAASSAPARRYVTTVTPLTPADKGGVRQDTHVFDGRSYCDDGKIWQVCDITDPLLKSMFTEAPVRETCDLSSTGWFHQGTWAKAKAVMKTQLLAVRFGRGLTEKAYVGALAVAHETPRLGVRSIKVPVPDLQLTAEEAAQIAAQPYHQRSSKRRRKRVTTSFSVSVAQKSTGEGDGEGVEGGERGDVEEPGEVEDEGEEDEDEDDDEYEEEEEDDDDDEEDDDNDMGEKMEDVEDDDGGGDDDDDVEMADVAIEPEMDMSF